MTGATIRVWASPSNPAVRGFEALTPPLAAKDVARYLRELDLAGCASGSFLLIPLAQTDHHGIAQAMEAASGGSKALRICLSVDHKSLERVDSRQLAGNQVGLVLDSVSLTTSAASIVHDVLEAVRFDPTFITDSQCSIRNDAALRAMLSLARSLGLATLGSATAGQRAGKIFEYPFDYVTDLESLGQASAAPASANAHRKSVSRTVRAG